MLSPSIVNQLNAEEEEWITDPFVSATIIQKKIRKRKDEGWGGGGGGGRGGRGRGEE